MTIANVESRHFGLLAFAAGIFCIQLDAFALNVALLQIGQDFEVSARWLKWVVSGYLLSVGTFMLAAGRLSDRFGHLRMLVVGLSLFGVASGLCGLANSFPTFLFARLIQGVGGACIMPAGLALLTNIYPVEQRGKAIGLAIGLGGVATASGPFIGGSLTQWFSWRLIFALNAPLILLALWGCYKAKVWRVHHPQVQRIDMPGLAMISLTIAILGVLLDELINRSLDLYVSLSITGLFCVLAISFVLRERRMSAPLIDLSLFRNRHYVVLSVAGAVANIATVAHLFIFPLSLQATWNLSPFDAGMMFLAPTLLLACTGPIAGRVRTNSAVPVMAGCLAAVAFCFITAAYAQSLWVFVLIMTLCGGALGVANALTLVATQAVVNPDIAGVASGVTKTLITVAAGLGVVLSGFAYQQALVVIGLCCLGAFLLLLVWQKRNRVMITKDDRQRYR